MTFVHLTRLIMPFTAAVALTGCLDSGGGSSGNATSTGRIHYQGLSGVSYQTASQNGTTNVGGEFQYYPGETLSLRVGNLAIAENVPAREFVTFLEFQPELRAALQTPGINDLGLLDHRVTEAELLNNIELLNRTRFLLALNWTENVDDNAGIDIRDRVIEQLNAALADPDLPNTLTFDVPQDEFTAEQSPANRLLATICFYPEDSELCDTPPTQAEIDAAPERPADDADIDPDVDYREDLENLADRITNATRTLADVDNEDAREYLERELERITRDISRRYVLDAAVASHAESDTAIKSVQIQRIGSEIALAEMEARSTRPQDVVVNAWSWQEAEVEYFVDGPAGGESELLINVRPDNTYRWVIKQIRVIID
ncbi:MAG: organic solvent ABC transporter permease [Pseudomonadota bacterium]|nr:organic solvent ABC transporter permease [Pseudomonadota bacterium]